LRKRDRDGQRKQRERERRDNIDNNGFGEEIKKIISDVTERTN